MYALELGETGYEYSRRVHSIYELLADIGGISKVIFHILSFCYMFFGEPSRKLQNAITYQKLREYNSKDIWEETMPEMTLYDNHMNMKFHWKLFCHSRCHPCYKRCYERKLSEDEQMKNIDEINEAEVHHRMIEFKECILSNFKYQLSVAHMLNNDLNVLAALQLLRRGMFKFNSVLPKPKRPSNPLHALNGASYMKRSNVMSFASSSSNMSSRSISSRKGIKRSVMGSRRRRTE